jgi:hypothetical protein
MRWGGWGNKLGAQLFSLLLNMLKQSLADVLVAGLCDF